jgi:hypothetical protein
MATWRMHTKLWENSRLCVPFSYKGNESLEKSRDHYILSLLRDYYVISVLSSSFLLLSFIWVLLSLFAKVIIPRLLGFSQVSVFISLNSWFHIKVPQQCAYILTFRFVGSAVVREIRTKRNILIKIDLLERKGTEVSFV